MTKLDTLLICDCAGSMAPDAAALARSLGAEGAPVAVRACSRLCTAEAATARDALERGRTLIACGQMAATFEEIAAEIGAEDRLVTADIRDRAGWTDARDPGPKQAALLAEALLPAAPLPVMDVVSDGVCLILAGAGASADAALDAAARLAPTLGVTVLAEAAPQLVAPPDGFELALGRVVGARGALGRFEVSVDGFAPLEPAGRGAPTFARARDGARSSCDVILDLRGGAPLFPAPDKRDGHLRADPGDPAAVLRAALEAERMVGTFEKPLHIRFDAAICAHSRAGQTGCSRCLDVCPTGAILPDGDAVVIDPAICAGCGACAAVCPSGAASFDAPPVEHLFRRLRTLSAAYRAADGERRSGPPRALFHDAHGAEMIALSARHGAGLPAEVIPVAVPEAEGVGHAEIMAALGVGFAEALVLAGPRTDMAALGPQIELAEALAGGAGAPGRVRLIEPADPDALDAVLRTPAPGAVGAPAILPVGGRREVVRLAASALASATDPARDAPPVIPLPPGAPYGATLIDTDACTLCLACVSLCPVGALTDNPDRPQVRFQEAACLQCGICVAACPEDAITLAPRLDLSPAALSATVLNEEEPFDCIECGKPFGVRSIIEKVAEKLGGAHWMYTESDNLRLIRMCDDCRVRAQYHGKDNPFAMGARPRVRTTDDYLNGAADAPDPGAEDD